MGEEGVMRGQEKEERRLKWREGVGERGREKEVGESQSPFWEQREGLRPREGGFGAQKEGEQEGDPARLSGVPRPHPGLVLAAREARCCQDSGQGGQGQEKQVTVSSYLSPL